MKKLMIIVMLMLSVNMISQVKVNFVKEGYYQLIDEEGNIFDSKASEVEAMQGLINYQLATGKIATMKPPSYRADLDMSSVVPDKEIDTVIVNTCFEGNKIWYHAGDINTYPHPIYIPMKETSMTKVMFNEELTTFQKMYQQKWKLERTKDHLNALTEYINKDVPFQFYITDSTYYKTDTSVTVKTFASETHSIMYYIDDELNFDGSANVPGQVTIDGGEMYRHTYTIKELSPGTNYQLKVVIKNNDGIELETTREISTL